jgi:hypothetical protein
LIVFDSFKNPILLQNAREMGFFKFDIEIYFKIALLFSIFTLISATVLFEGSSKNCATSICFTDNINSNKFSLISLSFIWILFFSSLGVIHAFFSPIILAWVIGSSISNVFGLKLILDNYTIFHLLDFFGIQSNSTQIFIAILSVIAASTELLWTKIEDYF